MKLKISLLSFFAAILINTIALGQKREIIELSGVNFAEIFIKINPDAFQIKDIVKEFWGNSIEVNEKLVRDTYRDNCLIIKYPNGIGIRNGQLSKSILVKQDKELIKKVNDFFHGNEFIYCMMAYDDEYSFGYSFIKNGKLVRYYFRDNSDEILKEYGLPFVSDLKAMNKKLLKSVDGAYIDIEMNVNEGWTMDYVYLPLLVTEYNMKEIIGYSLVNKSKHQESKYFKVNSIMIKNK